MLCCSYISARMYKHILSLCINNGMTSYVCNGVENGEGLPCMQSFQFIVKLLIDINY